MLQSLKHLCSGEEAVPAKKTKTVISTSEISQTRQTRVEKVGKTSETSIMCLNLSVFIVILPLHSPHRLSSPCALPSEDGGQLPGHRHDGDAGGGR